MMTDFIAAIELGSAKIKGIAGRLNADKSVQVLATAETGSVEFIRKGFIFNLDKTAQSIQAVIKELENQLGTEIGKVYVGIGGRSIKSMKVVEERELASDTRISQALIDNLLAENKECVQPEQEILWTEPQEYKIGNNLLAEPVGVQADRLTATFVNVVARRSLKQNIQSCMKQLPFEIAGFYVSPLATAESLLSLSDKKTGCALVDFGAETTTVVVYSGNILRHLAVIPLGSRNLTKDIMSHKIEEADAEQFKLQFGAAYTPISEEPEYARKELTLDNGVSLRALTLEETIEGRINEIIYNVDNQLLLSGYRDKLLGGVVLTGGGANLPAFKDVFERITKMSKVRLALGSIIAGSDAVEENGTYNTLIGALLLGKENCKKVVVGKDMFEAEQQQRENDEKIRQRALEAEKERQEREAVAAAEAAAAAATAAAAEERKRKEAQKRLKECDNLIEEAKQMITGRNFKGADRILHKLQAMEVTEKNEDIERLAASLKKAKKEGHWTKGVKSKMENFLTRLMGDGDEDMDNQTKK